MAIDTTIIEKPINFQNVQDINEAYRVVHLNLIDQANAAGSGAGAAVTTAISIPNLPASYMVFVCAHQKASVSVTSKTTTGFNVVLNPVLATETIAAGTFDCLVVYEI
jgi:hypothetical protein